MDDHYEVVISNPIQFELVVHLLLEESLFGKCEDIVADTKAITGTSNTGNRFF
jgi:hypothetical protein